MQWLVLLLLSLVQALDLYLVPHSHCDHGWTQTFDSYYEGKVKHILSAMLKLFKTHPDMKMVWAETAYFQQWFREQKPENQLYLRSLVQENKLEFVGGLVQNDEANTDFEALVRQLELSHAFLQEKLGVKAVKVGWQIDPFGHSAMTPAILASLDYHFLVINRINVGQRVSPRQSTLRQSKNLEFVWKGTDSNETSQVFTHVLHSHYSPPAVLDWDGNACFNRPNPAPFWYLLCSAAKLYELAIQRSAAYKHQKVMVLFGNDFSFDDFSKASNYFSALIETSEWIRDKLEYSGFTIRLATASEYFEAVQQTQMEYSLYEGDFFPYMSHTEKDLYWTGGYTNRPVLKKSIALSHQLARATELAYAFLDNDILTEYGSFVAYEACYALHHDIITGTCTEAVADDFYHRLEDEQMLNAYALGNALARSLGAPPKEFALALPFRVYVVFNPVNWEREQVVSFVLPTGFIEVLDWNLNSVSSQYLHTDEDFTIYFKLKLPGLTVATVFIKEHEAACSKCASASLQTKTFADNRFTLTFKEDYTVHTLQTTDGHKFTVNQQFWVYNAPLSGGYTVMPQDNGSPITDLEPVELLLFTGAVVQIAQAKWTRTDPCSMHFPFTQTIILGNTGTIKVKIGSYACRNEEVFVRFDNSGAGESPWLFTSNSIELIERTYQEMDPRHTGANMYPAPAGFVVNYGSAYLHMFSDYPVGILLSSPKTYSIQLHRQTPHDDEMGLPFGVIDSSLAEHAFTLRVGDLTHAAFFRTYFETKAPLLALPVLEIEDDLEFGLESPAFLIQRDWPFGTQHSFGFDHSQAYLSTARRDRKGIIFRFFNLEETPVDLSGFGLQKQNRKTPTWSAKTSGKIESPSKFVTFPKSSLTADDSLQPHEFAAFLLEIVTADEPVLENEVYTYENNVETSEEIIVQKDIEVPTKTQQISSAAQQNLKILEYFILLVMSVAFVTTLSCYLIRKKLRQE